jgi:hypothetical protein
VRHNGLRAQLVAHAFISTPFLNFQTKRSQECERGTLKRAPQRITGAACSARIHLDTVPEFSNQAFTGV